MSPRSIVLALTLIGTLLSACATPPPTQTSGKVPKDVFLQLMEGQSPQILCKNESYLSCLDVTQKRCETEVAAVAPKCTEQLMKTMPDYLTGKEDGRRYGEEYGKCLVIRQIAYGKYDLTRISKCKTK